MFCFFFFFKSHVRIDMHPCAAGSLSDRSSHAVKFFLVALLLHNSKDQSCQLAVDFMGTRWCTWFCFKIFEISRSAYCIFVWGLTEVRRVRGFLARSCSHLCTRLEHTAGLHVAELQQQILQIKVSDKAKQIIHFESVSESAFCCSGYGQVLFE